MKRLSSKRLSKRVKRQRAQLNEIYKAFHSSELNHTKTQPSNMVVSKDKGTKKSFPISTKFGLHTVVQPKSDSQHPCLMIEAQSGHKYLFGNIVEGSQRIFNSDSIKLAGIQGVFLTGLLSWSKLGGLPGFILSVSDQGVKNITVAYGNELLQYLVATWRYFVFRKGMDLNCKLIDFDKKAFSDDYLKVKGFQVSNSLSSEKHAIFENNDTENNASRWSIKYFLDKIISQMFPLDEPANNPNTNLNDATATEFSKSDPDMSDDHVNTKLPDLKAANTDLNYSTNYLVEFNPIRGKFDKGKAVALGVPPGKLFAQLSSNQAVTLENGTVVQPDQVLEPPRYYKKVLILDIVSKDNLLNLLSVVETKFNDPEHSLQNVGLVYYFLDKSIDPVLDSSFRKLPLFLNEKFGAKNHVISHPDYSPNLFNFDAAAVNVFRLKSLAPNNYVLPQFSLKPKKMLKFDTDQINVFPLTKSQVFDVTYDEHVNYAEAPHPTDVQQYWDSLFATTSKPKQPEFDKVLENAEHSFEKQLNQLITGVDSKDRQQSLKDYVQTIALGTGSALPARLRNVSSTIVRVPYIDAGTLRFRAIILDAGENTLGSLRRIYNEKQLFEFFTKELQLIYLSHLHADHHLGIVSLIEEWCVQNTDNAQAVLYLVAPWLYRLFMNDLKTVGSNLDFRKLRFISCEDFLVTHKLCEIRQFDESSQVLELIHKRSKCGANVFPDKLDNSAEFDKEETHFAEETFDRDDPSFVDDNDENNGLVVLYEKEDYKHIRVHPRDRAKRDVALISEVYKKLGLVEIITNRALHCRWSYCVSFVFALDNKHGKPVNSLVSHNIFKVSYSGDTRPSTMFATIGQDSDLLIHEATLEDELQQMAKLKMHSTISEAIDMKRQMKAKKLILTHFSQRYPKLPDFFSSFGIAKEDEQEEVLNNNNEQEELFDKKNESLSVEGFQEMELSAGKGQGNLNIEFAFDSLMVLFKDIGLGQLALLQAMNKLSEEDDILKKVASQEKVKKAKKSTKQELPKKGDTKKDAAKETSVEQGSVKNNSDPLTTKSRDNSF